MRPLASYRAPLLAAMAMTLGACDQTQDPMAPTSAAEAPALTLPAAAKAAGSQTAKVRIAFSIFNQQIYSVNMDGTGYKAVPNTQEGFDPAWSPDRRKLAFTSVQSAPGLYVINANGTRRTRLYEGNAWGPSWSPDGSQIAFVADSDPGLRVMVIRADGTDLRQLTPADGSSNSSPSWSPDGGRIAYEVYDTYGSEVWVRNADGTGPTRVIDCATLAAQCSSPVWSPVLGDERIALNIRDGDASSIVTVNANGTGWRTVLYGTEYVAYDLRPSWSPDATEFVFSAGWNGVFDLFVVSADGGDPRQLTTAAGNEAFPA